MSLQKILEFSASKENIKKGVSEERLQACLPELRNLISFYRKYPDIFIDQIKGPKSKFKFYIFQRVFLRVVMRYKWTYAVYPRA